jgi:hypothetical protein
MFRGMETPLVCDYKKCRPYFYLLSVESVGVLTYAALYQPIDLIVAFVMIPLLVYFYGWTFVETITISGDDILWVTSIGRRVQGKLSEIVPGSYYSQYYKARRMSNVSTKSETFKWSSIISHFADLDQLLLRAAHNPYSNYGKE